eukprot:2879817-Rhodomonas_salina.7
MHVTGTKSATACGTALRATPCAIILRACYAMSSTASGTKNTTAYAHSTQCVRYRLRCCTICTVLAAPMCGTEMGYAPTGPFRSRVTCARPESLSLRRGTLSSYAMSGTDIAYNPTRVLLTQERFLVVRY